MKWAHKSDELTAAAGFMDERSWIGLRSDGFQYVRLFGADMQWLRSYVFYRDGGACVDCGSRVYLELSHNDPRGRGGSDTEENCAVRCRRCHRKLDGHGEPLHY